MILIDKLNNFFDIFSIYATPKSPYWNEKSYSLWLKDGCNGMMNYMAKPNRGELDNVFKDSKSVIVVGKYYGNKVRQPHKALYSIGDDYHVQLKRELNEVLTFIKEVYPNANGRVVVDTAPVFEKALANLGGIGWIGRNSLVINEKLGSFFNIGVLLLDIELDEVKHKISTGCGDCRACIDACPMQAIRDDLMIDAKNCISYQTIELPRFKKEPAPEICGWNYGCDECQLACPYNNQLPVGYFPKKGADK